MTKGGFYAGGENEPELLIPWDLGRRHLNQEMSATAVFRPKRKVIPGWRSGDPPVTGMRHFPPQTSREPGPQSIRTMPEIAKRSGHDIPDPGLVLQTKNRVRDPNTGARARDRVGEELTLEKVFGLKHKVTCHKEMRNGITQAAPGDKSFKSVEYSPGYHKAGERIVGSSFFRQKPQEDEPLSMESTFVNKPTLIEKLWAQSLNEDIKSVTELTVSGNNGVSWEEQTGMLTYEKRPKTATEENTSAKKPQRSIAGK